MICRVLQDHIKSEFLTLGFDLGEHRFHLEKHGFECSVVS